MTLSINNQVGRIQIVNSLSLDIVESYSKNKHKVP